MNAENKPAHPELVVATVINKTSIPLLDHGYIRLVKSWGTEEEIIEAARMSSGKGFKGWGPGYFCEKCEVKYTGALLPADKMGDLSRPGVPISSCEACGHDAFVERAGDEKLLKYLWDHKHFTPFEMAGATFEVQAPIFVFREWRRHHTQSYNEMSARYTPLPDLNYTPTVERIMDGAKATANKQAAGNGKQIERLEAECIRAGLKSHYDKSQELYTELLEMGTPKELARTVLPVARYSKMRASTNLRNWFQFLELRQDPNAQYEIRVYADAVANLLSYEFPRAVTLFRGFPL